MIIRSWWQVAVEWPLMDEIRHLKNNGKSGYFFIPDSVFAGKVNPVDPKPI